MNNYIDIQDYHYNYNNVSYAISAVATKNQSYKISIKRLYSLINYEDIITLVYLIRVYKLFECYESIQDLIQSIKEKLDANEIRIYEYEENCEIVYNEKVLKAKREFKVKLIKRNFLSESETISYAEQLLKNLSFSHQHYDKLKEENRLMQNEIE